MIRPINCDICNITITDEAHILTHEGTNRCLSCGNDLANLEDGKESGFPWETVADMKHYLDSWNSDPFRGRYGPGSLASPYRSGN